MKHLSHIILLLLFTFCVGEAMGKTFTIDNITYMTYTEDPATAIVMGYKKKPVDVVIPPTVTYNDKEYTVTEIGEYAFKGCVSLKTMQLPSTITTFGSGAFRLCSSLESINIPDGVSDIPLSCFENCESLTSIEIPESVIEIGTVAFARCRSLKSVVIPDAVSILGQFAFNECDNLERVKIGSGVESVDDYTFGSCLSMIEFEISPDNEYLVAPEGVLIDKSQAKLVQYPLGNTREFYTVPEYVTSICSGSFFKGSNIKHVVCPDGLLRVEDAAFNGCVNLESISLGNSLKRIGGGSFAYCSSLKRLDLPATLNDIAEQAFFLNTSLEEFVVSEVNKTYTSVDGVLFNKAVTRLLFYPPGSKLKEYSFPQTVTQIAGHAFRGTVGLESVIINDGIETLPDATFYECTGLVSAYIPESVTLINHWAFFGCSSLKAIEIPANVASMGSQPFYGCTSLMEVTCFRDTPPSIGDETFIGVPKDALLMVPEESIESYRVAMGWDYFQNIMKIGSGVEEVANNDSHKLTVFNIDGVCVAKDVDTAYLQTLPFGVYVINGKKMMIR